MFTVTSDGVTD